MTPKDQHKTIRKSYLRVFRKIEDSNDETYLSEHIRDCKLAARNVVTTIVENIFFENHKVYEDYISINNSIVDGDVERNRPYGNSFNEKLSFLCDFGHIDSSLRHEYSFINAEGGMHSSAHLAFKEGEIRLIHVIKVFLNEILESFLSESEGDRDFLISMHIIAKDDPRFHNRVTNRIETFWNIRKDKSGFARYKTLLSYITGFLLSISFQLIGFIIAFVGILNTRKFVFDKKIKKKRFLAYGIIMSFCLASGIFSFIMLERLEDGGSFNTDPLQNGKGSLMFISNEDLAEAIEKGSDTIIASISTKGEQMDVSLLHWFHNNGINSISDGEAWLEIVEQNDRILIIGTLGYRYSDKEPLRDTIVIRNLKYPYHINFIEGIIANEQGKWRQENCNKYLYKRIVNRDLYFRGSIIGGNTRIGLPLGMLSNYYEGTCDSGYILSRLRLTKL